MKKEFFFRKGREGGTGLRMSFVRFAIVDDASRHRVEEEADGDGGAVGAGGEFGAEALDAAREVVTGGGTPDAGLGVLELVVVGGGEVFEQDGAVRTEQPALEGIERDGAIHGARVDVDVTDAAGQILGHRALAAG